MSTQEIHMRKAKPADIDDILALYQAARLFMHSHGNPTQWVNGYPGRADVERDLASEVLWVAESEGEIVGAMALVPGQDPTYAHIDGSWLDDLPYFAIHRIAASTKGSGIGRSMISWACERCGSVRSDTHEDNIPMQHALAACGFLRCGTIYLEDGSPRVAFQYQRPS